MDRAVMSQLPKLTGTHWYEWQKKIETYFMLIGCGGHMGSTKPEGDKGSEWDQVDQKVYAVIWFLVDPNYRGPIITSKSGKAAWAKLVAEYQKDNATNELMLHQQFYSIIHDPAIPVADFIEGVLLVARKLDAIGHKPSDTEISDKILIGLDNSWSPVRTTLTLRSTSPTVDEITSALKQYEANEMGVKQESADSVLYAKGRGGGPKRRGDVDDGDEDFDWGNTKNREGVCFRCGRPRHIAQFCVANMPDDVKHRILNHSAHTATIDPDDRNNDSLFAFATDHRPNRPTLLATAFSDLALTEFTLDSTNVNTATTATAQSVADSVIATPRKKKKKTGTKKSEPLEFIF